MDKVCPIVLTQRSGNRESEGAKDGKSEVTMACENLNSKLAISIDFCQAIFFLMSPATKVFFPITVPVGKDQSSEQKLFITINYTSRFGAVS